MPRLSSERAEGSRAIDRESSGAVRVCMARSRSSKRAWTVVTRSPKRASLRVAAARAWGSRSMPSTRRSGRLSSRASLCPPPPSVASSTTPAGTSANTSTISSTITGRWVNGASSALMATEGWSSTGASGASVLLPVRIGRSMRVVIPRPRPSGHGRRTAIALVVLEAPDLGPVDVAGDHDLGRRGGSRAYWRSSSPRVMRPCLSMVTGVAEWAIARWRLIGSSP